MKAALYIRLSREDDNDGPSESVSNQQALLTQYAAEHHMDVYDTYIDDGWSGGNFDRPAFQRLLRDIESKKVGIVITKDLSRLGRDYILTGHYLERYFPEHRVRYISLLDGIDTALDTSANDITPFRAIMNDMYAKDISRKIRSVKQDKQRKGKFIGPKAPYGYRKDPCDRNRLVIDDRAADIVRRIFSLAAEGESCRAIAQNLNAEGVPTPSAYAGLNSAAAHWSSERISELLKNETYLGHMVQGRRKKLSYKSSKNISLDPQDWIIVENTHEAIIDHRTFQLVRDLLENRRHTRCRTYTHPLSGLIFCHECGHPLGVINRKKANGSDELYFICRTHQRFTKKSSCSPHCIRVHSVVNAVWDTILSLYNTHVPQEELLHVAFQEASAEVSVSDERPPILHKLQTLSAQIETLYRDRLEHRIEEVDFSVIYAHLLRERCELQKKLSTAPSLSRPDPTEFSRHVTARFLESIDHAVLAGLIRRVELTAGRDIVICFRFSEEL